MHVTTLRSRTRRAGRAVRGLGAAVLLVTGLAVGATPVDAATGARGVSIAGGSGVDGSGAEGPSTIAVTQTPSGSSGICLPSLFALRSATSSDATTFTLRITVAAPLCAPLDVTAAVYAMPTNGTAWPQQLVERRGFVLQQTGVTEVTFTRDCTPRQFDVLTGPTPPVIAPWGEWHGPLLFPFDTSTAMQSFGCGPAPAVPEAPSALLLPLSAAAVVGVGAVVVGRRRRIAA